MARFEKVTVRNQSFEEFPATVMQLRGATASQFVLSFDSVSAMRSVFTDARVDLIRLLSERGALPMGELAEKLKRPRAAVARDVAALVRAEMVETEHIINPGHGRNTVVKPLARHYEFVWSIGAAPVRSASKNSRRKAA